MRDRRPASGKSCGGGVRWGSVAGTCGQRDRQHRHAAGDLLARSLFAPTELSISSVTAVFGAPVVIWLLVRRNSEREGA